MFNNPPGTVIREAAFCNEAVDMRVPFQRSPKCVKDTDEARNKASRLRGRGVEVSKTLIYEESRKIERELSRCRSEEKQLYSRGIHQDTITGLQATLHQLQGYDGKMQAFDGDQFILLVREVSVGKERELGFHLRCGLILHEPVI